MGARRCPSRHEAACRAEALIFHPARQPTRRQDRRIEPASSQHCGLLPPLSERPAKSTKSYSWRPTHNLSLRRSPQEGGDEAITRRAGLAPGRACPELRWLVTQLRSHDAVCIVGGEPKCCKSFLALDLAVAVAADVPCLRRFAVPDPGRVLL